MAGKETRDPSPTGTQPIRKIIRYRQKEREEEAYQAMNVDLSTVQGAAGLMAVAALRVAANPDRQGRTWGELAFGYLRESTDDPIEGKVRDMLLIGDRVHEYDMARHHIRNLHARDAYEGDAVIPNPVIPVQAKKGDADLQKILQQEHLSQKRQEKVRCVNVADPNAIKK